MSTATFSSPLESPPSLTPSSTPLTHILTALNTGHNAAFTTLFKMFQDADDRAKEMQEDIDEMKMASGKDRLKIAELGEEIKVSSARMGCYKVGRVTVENAATKLNYDAASDTGNYTGSDAGLRRLCTVQEPNEAVRVFDGEENYCA